MINNNQSGRSMIEMLGVLAIIGVLSVGGIAGYSKAMMKFKINKTIDQVSQIVANTRTLYARQRNYKSLGESEGSTNHKVVYKANLAPKEMFEDGSGSYAMTNPFGGDVKISSGHKNNWLDHKAFVIGYYGLPDEACIELATQDWGDGTNSGLIGIGILTGGTSAIYAELVGCSGGDGAAGSKIACSGGSTIGIPMPIDVAVEACQGNNNTVSWKFY